MKQRTLEDFKRGDWVRFYASGRLVIDEVWGTKRETGGYFYVLTYGHGEVSYSGIVARRPAPTDPSLGGQS